MLFWNWNRHWNSPPMLDSRWIRCPWCGERFEAVVDPTAGGDVYVEDCPVCCRPIELRADVDDDGAVRGLGVEREE